MSPLPACMRSIAEWSPHSSENRGGPPMTSAQYWASRSTCCGCCPGCENGWFSSGSARQRSWWAAASARNAGSPPANSYSVGRTRRAWHGWAPNTRTSARSGGGAFRRGGEAAERVDRPPDVLGHEVVVQRAAGGRALGGGDDDGRPRVDDVPGRPHARHVRLAHRVGLLVAESADELVVRNGLGPDEQRGPRHEPRAELEPGEVAVFAAQGRDGPVDDPDAPRVEPFTVLFGQWRGVGEVDDVRRPLAHEQRVLDARGFGAEDAERLVADLVAVAVRAGHRVGAPAFAQAGDGRQVVVDAGRDPDAPGGQLPAAREPRGEAGFERAHLVFDDLDAVAGELLAADLEQF